MNTSHGGYWVNLALVGVLVVLNAVFAGLLPEAVYQHFPGEHELRGDVDAQTSKQVPATTPSAVRTRPK